MNHSEENIFKRLEEELSTEVEVAKTDYYACMAFDERLLALLELEPPLITIATDRITTEIPTSFLFSANLSQVIPMLVDNPDDPAEEIIENVPVSAYAFRLKGKGAFEPNKVRLDATIKPSVGNESTIHLQNNAENTDSFIMYRSEQEGFYSEVIDTKSLLLVLGSLANLNPQSLKNALAYSISEENNEAHTYVQILKQLWEAFGEEAGSKETLRTLIHEIPQEDESAFKEILKLRYSEKETETRNSIHFTLEHSRQYHDLDVEDSHVLELTYTLEGNNQLAQDAARIISSGISPAHLIGIRATRRSKGLKSELDLSNPDVIELFVNWFDQLVSA